MMKKLKINGFKKIMLFEGQRIRPSDEFVSTDYRGAKVFLSIFEATPYGKCFVIHNRLEVAGWTTDPFVAFEYINNCSVYTWNEIVDMARGAK